MGCTWGAREVRRAIIDDPRLSGLHAIVVWIPMLDGDELPDAERMSQTFAGVPVSQLWDGNRAFGKEVSRSLGGAADDAAWDIYLFYPPGVEWTDRGLPAPDKMIAQSWGSVTGLKGTLPPKGDQSGLPPRHAGVRDIVGTPAELGALLSQIAVPFVERSKSQ
jgi:hypothetical protein